MISQTEKLCRSMEGLYSRWGYTHYTMSKFEEYDLYARHKEFLISDRVLTFTDPGGRLLALKPDVTLSIAKNTRDSDAVQKLYYRENVYRVVGGSFRELPQLGLEALGPLDAYTRFEVLSLAAQSLEALGLPWVLDVSHLGILGGFLDRLGVAPGDRRPLFGAISQKNLHGLGERCRALGLGAEDTAALCTMASLSGSPAQVLPRLKGFAEEGLYAQLEALFAALAPWEKNLRLDLSVVDDASYYTGLVCKGFVRGVSDCVLSGGQYGGLLRRLHRRSDAMGFALFVEKLQALEAPADPDRVVLLYGADTPLAQVAVQARALQDRGLRVTAQQTLPQGERFTAVYRLENGEVREIGNA